MSFRFPQANRRFAVTDDDGAVAQHGVDKSPYDRRGRRFGRWDGSLHHRCAPCWGHTVSSMSAFRQRANDCFWRDADARLGLTRGATLVGYDRGSGLLLGPLLDSGALFVRTCSAAEDRCALELVNFDLALRDDASRLGH